MASASARDASRTLKASETGALTRSILEHALSCRCPAMTSGGVSASPGPSPAPVAHSRSWEPSSTSGSRSPESSIHQKDP